MSILDPNHKKSDLKLIGVTLPPPAFSYVTLYTLAKGISKASLFKSLVNTFIKEQQDREPDNNLVAQVVKRSIVQWKLKKGQDPSLTFKEFKDMLEMELVEREVERKYIDLILKGLTNY
jgi:hypothetical protein